MPGASLIDVARGGRQGVLVGGTRRRRRRASRGDIDLLDLPVGARLRFGEEAVVEVTEVRNPCTQLDGLQPGLMAATLERDNRGSL